MNDDLNKNNFNREFESKTTQMLEDNEKKIKVSTFRETLDSIKKDEEKPTIKSERYNDPAKEEVKKKKNPVLRLLDKISGSKKKEQEDPFHGVPL